MNCSRMLVLVAPRALQVPISRVRSVMDTSIMFITPMPPTSSDMPAITDMAVCMVPSTEANWDTMLSMLKALTLKSRLVR